MNEPQCRPVNPSTMPEGWDPACFAPGRHRVDTRVSLLSRQQRPKHDTMYHASMAGPPQDVSRCARPSAELISYSTANT